MSIADRFEEVLSRADGQILPLAHSQLRLFVQNSQGRPSLVVDVAGVIEQHIDGSRGVRVVKDERSATQTYLRFICESQGMSGQFAALVEALLRAASLGSDPDQALRRLIAAYEEFRLFMSSRRGRLGEEAIRGLFGELLMVRELVRSGMSPHAVMLGWQGPFGGAQDFVLADGLLIEVKTMRPQNLKIRIASPEQLDGRGGDLSLAVVSLNESAEGGVAFLDLISRVREELEPSFDAGRLFQEALDTTGLKADDDDYYARWRFEIGEWRAFGVVEGFPRIASCDVPLGVADLRFSLLVDQLAPFARPLTWTSS